MNELKPPTRTGSRVNVPPPKQGTDSGFGKKWYDIMSVRFPNSLVEAEETFLEFAAASSTQRQFLQGHYAATIACFARQDVVVSTLKALARQQDEQITSLTGKIAALEATPALEFVGTWKADTKYSPGSARLMPGHFGIATETQHPSRAQTRRGSFVLNLVATERAAEMRYELELAISRSVVALELVAADRVPD
jgi:hypothetical protein